MKKNHMVLIQAASSPRGVAVVSSKLNVKIETDINSEPRQIMDRKIGWLLTMVWSLRKYTNNESPNKLHPAALPNKK